MDIFELRNDGMANIRIKDNNSCGTANSQEAISWNQVKKVAIGCWGVMPLPLQSPP